MTSKIATTKEGQQRKSGKSGTKTIDSKLRKRKMISKRKKIRNAGQKTEKNAEKAKNS